MGTELVVNIISFSYKKGIPQDSSPHGGGFVFDCRCLKNPGREAQYKAKTGIDNEVIDYLERLPEVKEFKETTLSLVRQAVENYLSRGHTNLMVCYGCTGGQHRSVYMAEAAALALSQIPGVKVQKIHRELEAMGMLPAGSKNS